MKTFVALTPSASSRRGPIRSTGRFRFEDPHTWARPWSFGMLLTRHPQSQVFEYACHEGNEGMRNMLKVARDAQKKQR